jgi:hypothetical protein
MISESNWQADHDRANLRVGDAPGSAPDYPWRLRSPRQSRRRSSSAWGEWPVHARARGAPTYSPRCQRFFLAVFDEGRPACLAAANDPSKGVSGCQVAARRLHGTISQDHHLSRCATYRQHWQVRWKFCPALRRLALHRYIVGGRKPVRGGGLGLRIHDDGAEWRHDHEIDDDRELDRRQQRNKD